jgi:hypothetical protein
LKQFFSVAQRERFFSTIECKIYFDHRPLSTLACQSMFLQAFPGREFKNQKQSPIESSISSFAKMPAESFFFSNANSSNSSEASSSEHLRPSQAYP